MEDYMLPCLSKKYFGVECLGCGMQRATALLFKGEFISAFKMYPGIYPLAGLGIFLLLNFFIKFKYAEKIKAGLMILSIIFIVGNYILKII